MPIVVGALEAIYRPRDWLGVLHVDQNKLENIQQTALLGLANSGRCCLSRFRHIAAKLQSKSCEQTRIMLVCLFYFRYFSSEDVYKHKNPIC